MSDVTEYFADINDPDETGSDDPVFRLVVLASDYDTLRTANQRLEGEVARLRADADRFIALVAAKLSVDVRTLFVVVEGDVYNKDCAPIVRHCQNDAGQRLNAAREAIDAALSTANGEVTG